MAYNLLFFSYFRLNFVANYDVMNITTQSSKHELACISFAILSKIIIGATYATYLPLLNIDVSVLELNHILSAINATRLKF